MSQDSNVVGVIVGIATLLAAGGLTIALLRPREPKGTNKQIVPVFNPSTGQWQEGTVQDVKAIKRARRIATIDLSKALLPLAQEFDIKPRVPGGFFATLFSAGLNVAMMGARAKTYNLRHFLLWLAKASNNFTDSRELNNMSAQSVRAILTKYHFKNLSNNTPNRLVALMRSAASTAAARSWIKFANGLSPNEQEELDEVEPGTND